MGVFAIARGSHSLTPVKSGDVPVTGQGHKHSAWTSTVPSTGKTGEENADIRWVLFELLSSRTEPARTLDPGRSC